jgi:hypothetical protein
MRLRRQVGRIAWCGWGGQVGQGVDERFALGGPGHESLGVLARSPGIQGGHFSVEALLEGVGVLAAVLRVGCPARLRGYEVPASLPAKYLRVLLKSSD